MANSSAAKDEKLLVRRAKAGDREAFRELVERYQERAFHLANEVLRSPADAEDVVQDAFVKAYLSLSKFKGDSSFYTWFYRIVMNLSIDARRRRKRRGGEALELDEARLDSADSSADGSSLVRFQRPDDRYLSNEKFRKIREVMDTLSEEHRTVVKLREFDGLSYDEIAKVVGITKGTVMSRLHYARKKLQKDLAEYLNSETPASSIGSEEKVGESGKAMSRAERDPIKSERNGEVKGL